MMSSSLSILLCLTALILILSTSTAAPTTVVPTGNEGADIHTPEYASPSEIKAQVGPKQQHSSTSDDNPGDSTSVDAAQPAIDTDTNPATGTNTDTTDQVEPEVQNNHGTLTTITEEDPDANAAHDISRPPAEELAEDAEILSEMRSRVERLLERQRALDEQLASAQRQRLAAASARVAATTRYSGVQAARGRLAAASRERDARLAALRAELPVYFENLRELVEEAERGQREITRLRAEKRHLLLLQRRLVDEFRSRGLENWIQGALASAVAPVIGRVVARGTSSIVEPVVGGINRVADIDADVGERLTGGLRIDGDAGRAFAFYSGLVSYLVVLLPLVLVISVIVRIRRRFLRLGLGHWIVLGNVYFGVLSVGCFFASQFGAVDVLVTIQQHKFHFYDFALVAHGVVYVVHVLCHVIYAVSARTTKIALHAVGVAAVGAHFYVHSYRHALKGEAPDVDPRAYFMYAVVFFYILFDLVLRKIITAALVARSKQNLTLMQRVRAVFQRAVTPRAKLIHPIPGGEALLSSSNQHIKNVSASTAAQGDGGPSGEGALGNDLRPCFPVGGLGTNPVSVMVEVGEAEKTGMIRSPRTRLGGESSEVHARHDLEAVKTL